MSYESLTTELLFTGTKDLSASLEKHGLEYRKGKTADDVRAKVKRGVQQGHGRTEFEISMVEVYLKDVLKVKKVKS